MIRLYISGVSWGVDAIEEINEETGEKFPGRQVNLLDKDSGILVHVPFSGESIAELIRELAPALTDAQRRQLAPVFTGSPLVVVPSNGAGPQG
jgi:hypothetical protein